MGVDGRGWAWAGPPRTTRFPTGPGAGRPSPGRQRRAFPRQRPCWARRRPPGGGFGRKPGLQVFQAHRREEQAHKRPGVDGPAGQFGGGVGGALFQLLRRGHHAALTGRRGQQLPQPAAGVRGIRKLQEQKGAEFAAVAFEGVALGVAVQGGGIGRADAYISKRERFGQAYGQEKNSGPGPGAAPQPAILQSKAL